MPEPFARNLGARIRSARERKGYSQRTLSKEAGYDLAQLNKIENGGAIPRADALARIALALDVSTDELVGLPPRPFSALPTPIRPPVEDDLREGIAGLRQAVGGLLDLLVTAQVLDPSARDQIAHALERRQSNAGD